MILSICFEDMYIPGKKKKQSRRES